MAYFPFKGKVNMGMAVPHRATGRPIPGEALLDRPTISGIGPIPHRDKPPRILQGPRTVKKDLIGIPRAPMKGAATAAMVSSTGTTPSAINVIKVPGRTAPTEARVLMMVAASGMIDNSTLVY